jgi:hypothetical protein
VRRPYPGGTVSAGLRRRHRESGAPLGTLGKGAHQAPDDAGYSSRSPSRAGDRRCPSRSGWGEAPAASDRGGRCRAIGQNASRRGPWPVTSRLATGPKGRVATCSSSDIERYLAREKKLRSRATASAVLRGSGGLGRAHETYRLQKLAVGARPISPTSEEPVDHDDGSSPPTRERWESEKASEAGSTAAKPRYRWRAPAYMWGTARAGPMGAVCR